MCRVKSKEATTQNALTTSTRDVPSASPASVNVVGGDGNDVDRNRVESESSEHLLGLNIDVQASSRGVESRDFGDVLVLLRARKGQEMSVILIQQT